MSYGSRTNRLGIEPASKLGHLEIIGDPLTQELGKSITPRKITGQQLDLIKNTCVDWLPTQSEKPDEIYAVDGSFSIIEEDKPPFTKRAFIKTALVKLDTLALKTLDAEFPHPLAIRDILQDSAIYHATQIPISNLEYEGMPIRQGLRHIIFRSIADQHRLEGYILGTLNWLLYQRWDKTAEREIPEFECPCCLKPTGFQKKPGEFPNKANCQNCGEELYLTDVLGFHQETSEEQASGNIVSSYMTIHETLLLLSAIRFIWESRKTIIPRKLFIKDGPLSVRAQYSKLVEPIRGFLQFSNDTGNPVTLFGQEKSGTFSDYLFSISPQMPNGRAIIPGDDFIKKFITCNPSQKDPYGKDTNYGAKVLIKIDEKRQIVLNIPTGKYKREPKQSDLIALEKIKNQISGLFSGRYENGLVPIEIAHAIASLSTYPSGKILQLFSEGSKT